MFFKVVVSALCAGLVLSGAIRATGNFDAGLLLTVFLVGLLPTYVFAFGTRTAGVVYACGAALAVLTAAGWSVVLVSDDPIRGVYVLLTWPLTLVVSIGAAGLDAYRISRSRGPW